MAAIEWTHEDADGYEVVEDIPAHWAICVTCQGNGKHSLALGAITQEDRERDWSEDEFEDYMAGTYDTQCDECHGSGKVLVPDWDRLEGTDLGRRYAEHLQDEADYHAMCAAERRMGA